MTFKALAISFLPPHTETPTVFVTYSYLCRFLTVSLCKHSFGEGLQKKPQLLFFSV